MGEIEKITFQLTYHSLQAFGGHRLHYQAHIKINIKLLIIDYKMIYHWYFFLLRFPLEKSLANVIRSLYNDEIVKQYVHLKN